MSAKASKGSAAVAAVKDTGELVPFLESGKDLHETRLEYGEGKMPIIVLLVWLCALTGLGIYTFSFLFPDLSAWGKP